MKAKLMNATGSALVHEATVPGIGAAPRVVVWGNLAFVYHNTGLDGIEYREATVSFLLNPRGSAPSVRAHVPGGVGWGGR